MVRLLLAIVSMVLFYTGVSFLAGGFVKMMARPQVSWSKHRVFRFAIVALPVLTTLWAIGTYLELAGMVGHLLALLVMVPLYGGWALYYIMGYLRRGR